MHRLRIALATLGLAAVLGGALVVPALAQPAGAPLQAIATYDGASFAGQSADTQSLFTSAFGSNAADTWAQQHNAQLIASGFVAPASASLPVVTIVNKENENDNGSDNDNGSHHRDRDQERNRLEHERQRLEEERAQLLQEQPQRSNELKRNEEARQQNERDLEKLK